MQPVKQDNNRDHVLENTNMDLSLISIMQCQLKISDKGLMYDEVLQFKKCKVGCYFLISS